MPNWCEGTIKVRGQKSDVIKWLNEGTSGTSWFDIEEPKMMHIIDCNGEIEVTFGREAYCEGTRRHFIKGTAYYYYDEYGEYEPVITLCFHQGEWYCLIGVVPCIERGIYELTYNPEAYGQYEPKNGWGTVSGALECLRNLRETIKDHLNGYDWNEYDIDHLYISW